MVTMWKLVNGSADHLRPSYLTTGKQKLTSDPNIRLEEIRHHGSTLIIDQVVQQEKLSSSRQKVTIDRGKLQYLLQYLVMLPPVYFSDVPR